MESQSMLELNKELQKMESQVMYFDYLRGQILREYKDAIHGKKDNRMVCEKTKQIEWQLSHIRDNIRMAREMLDILDNDFKNIEEE